MKNCFKDWSQSAIPMSPESGFQLNIILIIFQQNQLFISMIMHTSPHIQNLRKLQDTCVANINMDKESVGRGNMSDFIKEEKWVSEEKKAYS